MRVLTMGTFDMLHPGHLGLFEWCSRIADAGRGDAGHRYESVGRVIVAVNSDSFVKAFKDVAPRYTQTERMLMVKALEGVDEVIPNNGYDQAAVIIGARPDMIVIGSDWARKDYLAQLAIDQDWLDEQGIALAYVPRTGAWSSTELRSRGVAL